MDVPSALTGGDRGNGFFETGGSGAYALPRRAGEGGRETAGGSRRALENGAGDRRRSRATLGPAPTPSPALVPTPLRSRQTAHSPQPVKWRDIFRRKCERLGSFSGWYR